MIAYTLSSSEYHTKVRLHFAAFVFKNRGGGPAPSTPGTPTPSTPSASPSLPSFIPSEQQQILGVDLDLEEEEDEKDRFLFFFLTIYFEKTYSFFFFNIKGGCRIDRRACGRDDSRDDGRDGGWGGGRRQGRGGGGFIREIC